MDFSNIILKSSLSLGESRYDILEKAQILNIYYTIYTYK